MTPAPHEPNFFLVGAPKAGTTSVWRYLDQHPDVFMSCIKEPSFFAPEMVDVSDDTRARFARERAEIAAYLSGPARAPRQSGFVIDWEQYGQLFRDVRHERAVGEGTVAYLGSETAPLAIARRIPGARIVMILRDPADRLFSHYKAARAMQRTTRGFADWALEQRDLEARRTVRWGSFWAGLYSGQVARYQAAFSPDRLRIMFYDDLARDPDTFMRSLFTFLAVNPDCRVRTRERHNETAVPRWRAMDRDLPRRLWRLARRTLPDRLMTPAKAWSDGAQRIACAPDDRARVIDMYADDLRALEPMIDRDLLRWREA